eukprot:4721801-Pyramimonas_sp.AAC.1
MQSAWAPRCSGWGSWVPGGARSQQRRGKLALRDGPDTADLQKSSYPAAAASARLDSTDT